MALSRRATDEIVEHHNALTWLGIATAVGVPVLLTILGIAAYGWDAIDWVSAIVWGAFAVLGIVGMWIVGRKNDLTRMNLNDLMGSMFARPGTSAARRIGFAMNLVIGALLGVGFVYTMLLFALPIWWVTGMVWGFFIWGLSLIMFGSLGPIHPRIRSGEVQDPGFGAAHYKGTTPAVSLVGHLAFGFLLGLLYSELPLT